MGHTSYFGCDRVAKQIFKWHSDKNQNNKRVTFYFIDETKFGE